jgi:uncharacterized protein (UPF0332 family)
MNGRDFLPLAIDLAAGRSEAAWRTSLGRSYYAVFHVARTLLRDLGFVVPREDKAHSFLYFRLNNCGDAAVEQAARDLNMLRTLRNQADYDETVSLDAQAATAQISKAQGIIQTLDNLTPTERTQICDAMKIYERDVLQNVTWQP